MAADRGAKPGRWTSRAATRRRTAGAGTAARAPPVAPAARRGRGRGQICGPHSRDRPHRPSACHGRERPLRRGELGREVGGCLRTSRGPIVCGTTAPFRSHRPPGPEPRRDPGPPDRQRCAAQPVSLCSQAAAGLHVAPWRAVRGAVFAPLCPSAQLLQRLDDLAEGQCAALVPHLDQALVLGELLDLLRLLDDHAVPFRLVRRDAPVDSCKRTGAPDLTYDGGTLFPCRPHRSRSGPTGRTATSSTPTIRPTAS